MQDFTIRRLEKSKMRWLHAMENLPDMSNLQNLTLIEKSENTNCIKSLIQLFEPVVKIKYHVKLCLNA